MSSVSAAKILNSLKRLPKPNIIEPDENNDKVDVNNIKLNIPSDLLFTIKKHDYKLDYKLFYIWVQNERKILREAKKRPKYTLIDNSIPISSKKINVIKLMIMMI